MLYIVKISIIKIFLLLLHMQQKRSPRLKNNDLHALIQSLTKSEKRYYKLFARLISRSKMYEQLFNAILKQKEYDEETLKRNFKGTPLGKNLQAAKKYLFEHVLTSLRLFHHDNYAPLRLNNIMQNSVILNIKGHRAMSENLLDKLIKKSKEISFYEGITYTALVSKLNLQLRKGFAGVSLQQLNQLRSEIDVTVQMLLQQRHYYFILSEVNYPYKKRLSATEIKKFRKDNAEQTFSLQPFPIKNNLLSNIYFFEVSNNVLRFSEDTNELYKLNKQYFAFMLQNRHQFRPNSIALIMRLTINIAGIFNTINKLDDALKITRFAKEQINIFKSTLTKHIGIYYTLLIDALVIQAWCIAHSKKYSNAEAKVVAEELSEILKNGDIYQGFQTRIRSYWCLCKAYFLIGDYKNCIRLLQVLSSYKVEGEQQINLIHAEILSIMVYIEKGDYAYLPYIIRSVSRKLKSQPKTDSVLLKLIGLFKSIAKHEGNEKATILEYRQFSDFLQNTTFNPPNQEHLNDLSILPWIKGKLTKTPLRDNI